ncbi:uncharacterized protein N7459_008886, partial [Penicillium hispanicum]|uniref:uncharacterized protein n=1 Tax=Penicillium hispanicum TaxID=1080232 RepID=UPI00253FB937
MMASISMIDCHFIMFFNNPPHFTQAELDFDLPAEDRGIDISDEVAWQEWALNERKYQRPPSLSQLLKELLSDHWTGSEEPRFENLNIFTLFIVISAFHRIIYGIRYCILDTSNARRQIDRALLRWMRLWENLQPRLSQDEIYRAGFMTHAQDLWVFAKFLLRQPLSETGGIARDSMTDIHRLLKGPLNE